jgi:chromosome segregation ATPase
VKKSLRAAVGLGQSRISKVSWVSFESDYEDDQDGLRARSEQAIGELAQALLDSNVLENAVSAAFGAREKALEAQQAAMAALNLPSAGDVERLERRLRSLSQRLDEVEDELDRVSREVGGLRRELARRDDPGRDAGSS